MSQKCIIYSFFLCVQCCFSVKTNALYPCIWYWEWSYVKEICIGNRYKVIEIWFKSGSNMGITTKTVIAYDERKEIGTLECILFIFGRHNLGYAVGSVVGKIGEKYN